MPIRVHAVHVPLIARVSLDPPAVLGSMLGEQRTDEVLQLLLGQLQRVLPYAERIARVGLLDLAYAVGRHGTGQNHELVRVIESAARSAIGAFGGLAQAAPCLRIAVRPAGSGASAPAGAGLAPLAAGDVAETTASAIALVALLDARDPQASTHAWHVSVIAERIAGALGLGAAERERCALAGLVHDLGKAAIPDRILFHPGPLLADDWSQIHRHPAAAASLLSRLPDLSATTPAVLHHHERIDGAGYPAGLAGDDIPLEARILAVADTYSALTAHRPYRPAQEPRAALACVDSLVGTQFDGAVVAALRESVARRVEH